jgi:hypothetical protein
MGETIYTAEEDVHFPTLTVRQTLTAALKCKTPHKRTNQMSRKVFVDRLMNMLLQIFGLTKQIDTVCVTPPSLPCSFILFFEVQKTNYLFIYSRSEMNGSEG